MASRKDSVLWFNPFLFNFVVKAALCQPVKKSGSFGWIALPFLLGWSPPFVSENEH